MRCRFVHLTTTARSRSGTSRPLGARSSNRSTLHCRTTWRWPHWFRIHWTHWSYSGSPRHRPRIPAETRPSSACWAFLWVSWAAWSPSTALQGTPRLGDRSW